MTINDLKSKWEFSASGQAFIAPTADHPLDFHIGYFQGQKCFIIMNTGKISNTISSKGVRVECTLMSDGNYSLMFILQYESLEDLFVKLCWDLITYTKISDNPMEELLSRYSSWIKMLQKVNESELPWCSEKGLVGELIFLDKLIEKEGEDIAIASWVGPEGSDQDFVLNNKWVEVKTTGQASHKIKISSLEQLDRDDYGELKVYYLDKSPKNINTVSLGELAEKISNKLADKNKDEFWCKLVRFGVLESDIENYKKRNFRLSGSDLFGVEKDFPRLTKNNVPKGIVGAKYDLDLVALDDYKLSED